MASPRIVRTLKLHQARGRRWLGMEYPGTISDHFFSFDCVEGLDISRLDPDDFEPGGFTYHFGHYGSIAQQKKRVLCTPVPYAPNLLFRVSHLTIFGPEILPYSKLQPRFLIRLPAERPA